MPNFKDFLKSDMKAFLNTNEFADEHNIDGQDVTCIFDQEKSTPSQNDGVYVVRRHLFIDQSILGYRPAPEQKMYIDGSYFYVVDCVGEGLIEVILEARDS
jgi:hypothetical protein